ncbi:hypothetical protein ACKKBF_B40095 [Auxenochlorella protothecoides x Auxenochlorella symbiontica]
MAMTHKEWSQLYHMFKGALELQKHARNIGAVATSPDAAMEVINHDSSYGAADEYLRQMGLVDYSRITSMGGLLTTTGNLDGHIKTDSVTRAKLNQILRDPAAWSKMSDAVKRDMMDLCVRDESWKEGIILMFWDEMWSREEVNHFASPSPVAHESPAHRAHSGTLGEFNSETENVHDLSTRAPAVRSCAMPKVPPLVSQTAEAPAGVLTRSDINKFKELEIQ